MTGKDDRAERLAAALRENLRRRKAQARGNVQAGTQAGAQAEPGPVVPTPPPADRED